MNIATWARLLAWLAAETTVLLAGAAMLHLWLRSPRAGRIIWRAALTAVALVWLAELSGLRERMSGPDVPRDRYVITATVMPSSAPAEWQRRPAADLENSGETPLPLWGPLWIWLSGSMLLLARCCLARFWLARRRRAAAPADEDSSVLIARWQKSFGLRRVQSQIWDGLRGPVAFGVFRPTVALPPDFVARFSRPEREAMLAHEMAHLAAHDPFWWMVSDAVIALAWWHPLIWWARRQLQSAHEAAADEASVLIPGGARTLAECLVRLGRELTDFGPGRALGVGGNGPRSQLAARIERLLREPRAWQPMSAWARWTPQVAAIFAALASALLPIQTGLSGSILAVLATTARAHAENPPSPPAIVATTNQPPAAILPAPVTKPAVVPLVTNPPETALPIAAEQLATKSSKVASLPTRTEVNLSLASPAPVSEASPAPKLNATPSIPATNPPPEVMLLVRFVCMEEHGPADLGLDWLFGVAPTNNPSVETNHDWVFGLRPMDDLSRRTNHNRTAGPTSPAAHPENLVIEHLLTKGQTAILKPEQFAALLKQIEKQSDVLAAPSCQALSGQQAEVFCGSTITCVTGVQATIDSVSNHAGVNYSTENIGLGIAANVSPKLEYNGQWRLVVRACDTAFIGYDNYGKKEAMGSFSVPGGKPLGYVIPHPHFRAVEADAAETLSLGQTLALRGPMWIETTKTKGHFLAPSKTKTVHQRLYIFVTPTCPTPSQMNKP